MEKTLHMRMRDFWNSVQNGEKITAVEFIEKLGVEGEEKADIRTFLANLKARGIAETREGERPVAYKKLRSIIVESPMYRRMKEVWNSMQNRETITSVELREKVGGKKEDAINIRIFLSKLKARGIAETQSAGRLQAYKKVSSIAKQKSKTSTPKAEPKEKKSFEETEFTSLEIGQGVMAFVKDLQDLAAEQKETISAMKRKADELMVENKRLKEQLDREKEKVILQKGETTKFSRPK